MLKKAMIILVICIAVFSILYYYSKVTIRKYRKLVDEGMSRTNQIQSEIIKEEDINHLPAPVQKYLRYVGVIGKEKMHSIKININGEMKMDIDKDWAPVKVEQVSFFDRMTRLFYIKMSMNKLPISGLHYFKEGTVNMVIKILGLFKVVDGSGQEMNIGETVTVFNDICILAPSGLIEDNITWESIDDLTAKGIFSNDGITVSAILYFNKEGQLINFISEDRYFSPTGKTFEKVTWSTPISDYKNINGYNLASYGEAKWKFPNKDFTYAKFYIKDVIVNPGDGVQ